MSGEKQHPAFPQPTNANVELWRYMDISKFEWLLENSRLFMPVTEKLGPDVLEGTQPTGDKKWWEDQIENEEDINIKEIIKRNSEIIVGFSNQFKKNYFVSCWHMNSTENNEMWKCYTNSSESLAIRTSYNKLKNTLPNHINIGMVHYINYKKEKLPSFNLFEYIMHKDVNYTFENEVRAVAAPLTEAHWESNEFKGHIFQLNGDPDFIFYGPVINVENLIQNITLHPNATPDFRKRMKNLCTKHGLPQPINSSL